MQFPTNDGPVQLRDSGQVRHDISTFEAALRQVGHTLGFMTAASPGVIETFMPTTYYPSDRAYLETLGAVMADEYRAIVDAGFILQLDCPDLAMSRTSRFSDLSDDEFRTLARLHVEVLNRAVEGLPRSRMRLHLCWGNYEGPHNRDIPLDRILDVALEANVGALRFADIVGPERVIAGTDCGFGTSVGPRHVAASIAWAKLGSLVEGARIASAAYRVVA